MSHRITFLWTVPRSVSTSFERMMMERGDHVVFDEPFSRSYYFGPDRRSARYTESLPDSSAEQILSQIEDAARERPVFVKDMAYQAATLLGTDLLKRFDNCFLVRDPAATGGRTSARPCRSSTRSANRGSCSTPTCSAAIPPAWSSSGASGWVCRTSRTR
jgi:hypothetical protein